MARAIVPGFMFTFGTLPDIQDDVTNGWFARFQVIYTGSGITGFLRDLVEVHFLDTDLAVTMDNKIRDAVRAKGAELGVPDAANLMVISFLPPRRL